VNKIEKLSLKSQLLRAEINSTYSQIGRALRQKELGEADRLKMHALDKELELRECDAALGAMKRHPPIHGRAA
jgi:hypothetical protein